MKSNLTTYPGRAVALLTSFAYFIQGSLSISGIAFPLLLRQKGWSISEIAAFSFTIGIPWTLKIIYGAITDAVPIFKLRRKPYIMIASVLSALSWLCLAFNHERKAFLYGFSLLANLGFAMTDVVIDALIVENSNEENAKVYQSLAWGWKSFGAVVGGFLGGWLAGHVSYRLTFTLTALLPMSTLIAAFFIHEPHRDRREAIPLWFPILEGLKGLFRGDLKWFSLLLLVGSFSASVNTPFFFFLKEKLKFSPSFLGSLTSIGWLGTIIGCFLYAKSFKQVKVKTMLRIAFYLSTLNILTAFLIRDPVSAATLSFLGGVLGYLGLLPLLSAAALLSKQKQIEGSLFALLMSVYNLGQLLATLIGGKLFGVIGLEGLFLLSAAVTLSGVFFVNRLKSV